MTAVASQRGGFATVGMSVETSRTNKTAVSNAARYTYFPFVFLIVSGIYSESLMFSMSQNTAVH